MTSRVFISYAREDSSWAERLKGDLEGAGYTCWLDTSEILEGDEWVRSIATGITRADACLSLVSNEAQQSPWVLREFLFAGCRDKPVIPLLLEECELPLPMIDLHSLPLYRDYQTEFNKLLATLEKIGQRQRREAPPSQRRQRELDYLSRLQLQELLHIELYTPLAGIARRQARRTELNTPVMRPELKLLSRFQEQPDGQAPPRRFDDVRKAMRQAPRVVLLGEPGAGKTTALWRLAADALERAEADPAAALPLLVPLGKWTDAEQSLMEFIQQQLGELGVHLEELLQERRALLLLDGLNEVPTAYRAVKAKQVQRLVASHPQLEIAVTCRELDYTGELKLELDTLTLQSLDPRRIRDFIIRYMEARAPGQGQSHGEKLFWRLTGGEAVRKVWEAWQAAGADLALFFYARDIPRENPNVYRHTTGALDALWREKVRDDPRSLMRLAGNPYLLLMLTAIYQTLGDVPANRAALFDEFVEILLVREELATAEEHQVQLTPAGKALLEALGRLAWALQTQAGFIKDGYVEEGYVLTALDRRTAEQFLDAAQLHQAAAASLLVVGAEEVRFTHQLLQEYFTAQGLRQRLEAGNLQAAELWPKTPWWTRTGWEETAVLLAGLYKNDCTPVVDWLAAANPEVAAECIARSGAEISDETLAQLRALWLPRLTDLTTEPRPEARAALGRVLGRVRLHRRPLDNRPGVGLDAGGLPQIDWVEIPAGAFLYQRGKRQALPAFAIARYPITQLQFQAFIDDGGYEKDLWWEGLAERMTSPEAPYWDVPNHPRETVSWYEAVAFCRWLSAQVGSEVRLPTEQEWEKAARGTDGREYPWGQGWQEGYANTHESGLMRTTAVGIYPQGASPYGVLDMAGNVWEWCLNAYGNPSNTQLEDNEWRVVRGGAWRGSQDLARAAARYDNDPVGRDDHLGFRVCRCSPR